MQLPVPSYCRPEAFELLASQLPSLDTTAGLVRAAVAVSMHELDDTSPDEVEAQIEELVQTVAGRLRSREPRAILAHAHAVLFDQGGFCGDVGEYYSPQNSYLPVVLRRRRGLPITLTLVYKAVLEELGLPVEGVNAPGHFLARIEVGESDIGPPARMLIDPFQRGRMLTSEEAFARMDQVAGGEVPRDEALLSTATHKQWLMRLLQNLIAVFDRLGRADSHAAMLEMRALVRALP